jgi:hypothetical protein
MISLKNTVIAAGALIVIGTLAVIAYFHRDKLRTTISKAFGKSEEQAI